MIWRPGVRRVAAGLRGAAGPGRASDRGSVTAETAVVLPVLVLAVALGVWLVLVALAQLRCVDAAHAAARAAGRGEPVSAVRAATVDAAPAGAQVTIAQEGRAVTVAVPATVRPFGGLLRLVPSVHVGATAHAESEAGS